MSFTDLVIPVAGVPITVTRTYDSRVKTKRDFGVGWSLDVATGKYSTNRKVGDGWVLRKKIGFGQPLCGEVLEKKSHRVEVRLSDREVFRFKPAIVNTSGGFGFCEGDVVFTETDSVRPGATLQLLGGNQIWQQSGFDVARDAVTMDVFDPKQVRLTTPEGNIFDLDKTRGIIRIEDRNGNVLYVNKTGLVSSTGKSVLFTRDAQGRISKITDPSGATLQYLYDGNGDLIRFSDQEQHETRFSYLAQPAHHLDEIINALGVRAVRNEYDQSGRLIATIDPAGNRVEFDHDLAGQREVTRDRLGHPTELVYDDRGNVTRETQYATIDGVLTPVVTTKTFDEKDNLTSVTDALGHTERTTFDAKGNVSTEAQLGGAVFRFQHNARNDLLTLADSYGHTSTRTYDAKGNMTAFATVEGAISTFEHDARGLIVRSTNPDGVVLSQTYSAQGRLASKSDSLGNVTTFEFDANGRNTVARLKYVVDGVEQTRETRWAFDKLGHVVAETNALGEIRRFEFDALGNVTRVIEPSGRAEETVFDELGRIIRHVDPSGVAETRAYDAEGRLTRTEDSEGRFTEWSLDERGLPLEIRTGGPGVPFAIERRRYDILGRLIEVEEANSGRSTFEYDKANRLILERDALGQESHTEYDLLGRVVATVDALGRRVERELDAGGRVIKTIGPDGAVWRAAFDAQGRTTRTVSPEGRDARFEYGPSGKLLRKIDGEGHATEYVRDSQGELIGVRDAKGRLRSYERDALGRRVRTVLPGGAFALRGFDEDGRLSTLNAYDGRESRFEHDLAGRVARKTLSDGSERSFSYSPTGRLLAVSEGGGVRQWTYDGLGRVTSRSEPFGAAVRYEHDALGRVTAIETPHERTEYRRDLAGRVHEVETSAGVYRFARDPLGRLIEVAYPNGLREVRGYTQAGPVERVTLWAGTATIASYAYSYDRDGLRIGAEESARTVYYSYDRAARLVEEVVSAAGTEHTTRYELDGVGNRTAEIVDGARVESEYDDDDRLQRRLAPGGQTSFTWDANGTLRSATSPDRAASYIYSPEDQLIAASLTSAGSPLELRYAYDHAGQRIEKQSGADLRRYLVGEPFPQAEVLEELGSTGDALAVHSWTEEGLLASRTGAWSFHHHDGRGDVRADSDAGGQLSQQASFSAFGVPDTASGGDYYGMGSQAFDEDLGMYYLRARYMDPELGKFITRDPLDESMGASEGRSTYTYASADPINRNDPSGLQDNLQEVSVAPGIADSIGAGVTVGINRTLVVGLAGLSIAAAALSADTNAALEREIEEAEACIRSRSKKCKIKFPLFFPGTDTQRTTEHITDAIEGNGDTWPKVMHGEAPARLSPVLVRGPRDPVKYDGEVQCDPTTRSYYHADFDVERSVCDEYPFASSVEGGDANYVAGLVSIRLTSRLEGDTQGGKLSGFYRECGRAPAGWIGSRVFGVVPQTEGNTFWVCDGRQ